MAYGDSILDAAIKTYTPLNSSAQTIEDAQKIQYNQSILAQQQLQTGEAEQEMPLKAALTREQTKNSLLSNAIATAPDAQTWDNNMRELAKTFPEAQQYVGRYSPVLQSRLMSVYQGQPEAEAAPGSAPGGASGTKGATNPAANAANLDYQFSQTTPDQRAQALEKLGSFSQELEQVGDENSWNAMRKKLDAAGFPIMDQLGDYSPIKAASLYQRIQPTLSYLQGRVVSDQAGVPVPKAVADIKPAGNSIFAIDPNNPYAPAKNIATAPEFQGAGQDMMGNPVVINKATGQTVKQGPGDGVFGFDDFADRMNGLEKGANRTAQNPNSSATGDGQFTDATWLKTIKAARPELADNMSDKQLLQLRKDPAIAKEMTAEYARNNAAILEQNGQHVNATSLALAHRFGPQGALAVLSATPDTPLSSILSADAIKANPGLEKQTAGDYVKDLSAKAGLESIGTPVGGVGAVPPDAKGDELLKALPPAMSTQVKALAEGRMAFPSGFALRSPYWQNMLRMVSQYDPSFDAINFNARSKTRDAFTGNGKAAQTINNLNTAIGHAGKLLDQIPGTEGLSGFPGATWVNAGVNAVAQSMGKTGVPLFKDTAGKLAQELTAVYRGGGGAERDVVRGLESLDPNASTETKKAILGNAVDLLDSKLEALGDQYNTGMGTSKEPITLLNPVAQKTYSKLKGLAPSPDEQSITSPQAGQVGRAVLAGNGASAPAGVIQYDKNGKRVKK